MIGILPRDSEERYSDRFMNDLSKKRLESKDTLIIYCNYNTYKYQNK